MGSLPLALKILGLASATAAKRSCVHFFAAPRSFHTCAFAANKEAFPSRPSAMSTSMDQNSEDDSARRNRKKILRKEIRSKMKSLTRDEITAQSSQVWDHLFALPEYQQARSVGLFLSMPSAEIDTEKALVNAVDSKKAIYVPQVGENFEKPDMELIKVSAPDSGENVVSSEAGENRVLFYHEWPRNKWGIPEPPKDAVHETAQPGDIDLLVVPGLAFDQHGGRLGQGKGYYDRFISKMRQGVAETGDNKPLLVAVGLEPQFVDGEGVPMSAHDIAMDLVVLPNGALSMTQR